MHFARALSLLVIFISTPTISSWPGDQGHRFWLGYGDRGDSISSAAADFTIARTCHTARQHGNWSAPPGPPTDIMSLFATPAQSSPPWASSAFSRAFRSSLITSESIHASASATETTLTLIPGSTSNIAPSSSSATSGTGYMAIVNQWRGKLGMSDLVQDSRLEANDLKTLQDSPGQMVHELNSGSMAQVLAPGDPDDFEKVFVGGWLCEKPEVGGLDGICDTMSQGWSYNGETGHADILESTSYSKIGCANYEGIWGCDLA